MKKTILTGILSLSGLLGGCATQFDPQGRWLATASEDDMTVWLWDLTDPQAEPRLLSGHEKTIVSLEFDSQGRWLATGSEDGTVRLWELRIEELVRKACKIADRNMTREEWRKYLGDKEYRPTCPEYPVPDG